MKLGIITSMASTPWGGSEELWVALAQKAINSDVQVSVSVYDWNQLPIKVQRIKEAGASIHLRSRISYTDFVGKVKGKLNQLLVAEKQLHEFVKEQKCDIVLLSTGAFCDLEINPLRKFLLKTEIPFCIVIHSNTETHQVESSKIKEIQEVCAKAKAMFFVSKRIQAQSEKQINVKLSNALPAINPLNIDMLGILPLPDMDIIKMACVGSLQVAVKGQDLLIQVLASQKWKERNWELSLFGYGPDEELIKRMIAANDLNDRIFLRGFTNDIRQEVWSKHHLLVMPSFIEGMPIALLEAMLCGRPAVVTDVGGNKEIVIDNHSGYIAATTNVSEVDNALERAWNDRSNWAIKGANAFEDASRFYGKDPIGDLLKLIEQKAAK